MFRVVNQIGGIFLFLCLITFSQADVYQIPSIKYPDLGTPQTIESNIALNEVKLEVPDWGPVTLRIFRPKGVKGLLPTVFVAPAGTNLISGSELGKADMPEQTPYAKAGYIVVAYSLPGQVGDNMDDTERGRNMYRFMNSKMGVLSGLLAIDYALTKIPEVNPEILVTAGHSSAGMVSLQLAMSSEKITHCIAYAPCTSYLKWFGQSTINELCEIAPDLKKNFDELDPLKNADKLKVPMFLFSSQQDGVVSIKDTYAYVKEVKKANENVIFKKAKSGDHYNSMIEQGIPHAIKWIKMMQMKSEPQTK